MLIKAFTTCWCACKWKAFVSDCLNWTDIPNKTGIENPVKGFLAPQEASGIITQLKYIEGSSESARQLQDLVTVTWLLLKADKNQK